MMPANPHVRAYRITDDARKLLGKSGDLHKYAYGHAIIVSGPSGQGGAARLAARGALRIGAGLVSVFCGQDSRVEHAARLDAIMVKLHTGDTGFGTQLSALKPSAVCIGPNLGLDDSSRRQLADTLSLPCPLCLDADAITLIGQTPDLIKAVTHAQIVMTPHEGELRRLIPKTFTQTTCRVSLAKTAARQMGCCVLFKGADTIVARPDGACVAVKSGQFAHAAWLATAGSGDVLAGFITGLMARGFDAYQAACLGAALHLRCAQAIGPGLIAEDIPEALPAVLARCLSGKL
jgi:hydroxyethylthiazole kinase-like uncharacterized protein yjeF